SMFSCRVYYGLLCLSSVAGRNSSSTSMPNKVYRYCKGCFMKGCVAPHHQFQPQFFATALNQWGANESSAMRGHKIHDFGGNTLGSTNEVAFIFSIFIIHNYNDFSISYGFYSFFYSIQLDCTISHCFIFSLNGSKCPLLYIPCPKLTFYWPDA